MIKAVGFDLDDTLYDHKSYEFEAFKEVSKLVANNFKVDEKSYFKALKKLHLNGQKSRTFDIAMQECIGFLPDNWEDFMQESLLPTYRNFKPKKLNLYSEAKEFLEQMLKYRYKLILITNGNYNIQNSKIDALKIREYFDLILISDDFIPPKRKPNTYMFERALKCLKIKPYEMVYIGDDLIRDKACERVGIKFIDINSTNFSDLII